ncbi:MAG TPA: NADH-quinone oxidoreductase subunit NuoK [Methanomassiliicoccaceae archaeon]|jgi:NADH:ubiquinone oxidoreductase subunit K|nr:NADH-quinone oxidoreductase subunit NuoK [Euryarchaeota archaeon]HOB37724.1 NADH-quinone oxidoreductase subunit NuoK [Methanomassiliicoccaceae archaeon]HOK28453.1 NADH-quinone oxidoreductase subunit NuoK [Methanomassiliicoccaceae archaeon]HOL06987.1 NADH-quinone oxidoreductase subunit NuoK [Methanomassiliicoccaceae archaeon]HOQ25294.1 NADH-quinone oxidoreductase subunit NuoK [Methanomassiliicoccaceae archaeon]
MIPIEYFLALSGILFVIGALGVLTKKNAIVVLMSVEVMLNAANINFVAFSAFYGSLNGAIFALVSIAIAAAEVAVGLAIIMNLYKTRDTISLNKINLLRW